MKRILIILFVIGITLSLCGQDASSFVPTSNISAYSFDGVRSGVEKLKINVYIWGQVYKPGLYVVPDDTDLLTLISLAGGPREDAKLSKVRIIRPTNIGERVLYINLKDYMETGDEKIIPKLQPGDTIVMSGTIFYAFSRLTDFLSKAAIAIGVYTTVSNIK
ncbi:MAG: hypothetical protein CVU48_04590 [Candidatus Cloacimonetes bacterium HGW-Cloacimonetes-1]|nr:MAG: hypothetical protein CVU48_04590 [Candidatus Cloacimonetes bacterium HGW-Cloacimonetes-1]